MTPNRLDRPPVPGPVSFRPPVSRAAARAVAAAWLVVASLAVAACGREPGEPAAEGSGPIVVSPADVHVVATPEAVAEVRDLEVLPDGTVWLLNSVEPLFVGLGPGGEPIASYGRTGGGPEEFRAPAGFVAGGLGGEAWVFDRGRHALLRVAGPEATPGEIPLPRAAIPPGTVLQGMSLFSTLIRTALMGDEVVIPRRAGTGEFSAVTFWTTIWNAHLVALDPGAGATREIVSVGDVMGDLGALFDELEDGFVPFPLWFRLWAVCGPDRVRLYDFTRDELRGFAANGAELPPVAVPAPFREATPRQFARAVFDLVAAERVGEVRGGVGEMSAADSAQLLGPLISRLEASPERLGGLLPKYVDFRCAEDGTMWMRPLDLERGGLRGAAEWLRIAPDGSTREVRFPERFDPYRFTGGRVWGVLRDELDIASVAWTEDPAGG